MGKRRQNAAIWQAVCSTIDSWRNLLSRSVRRTIRKTFPFTQTTPWPVLCEPLEYRTLLTGSPYIIGSNSVEVGTPYAVNLVADGTSFDHWHIAWGDGTTSTVSSSNTSSTHSYAATGTFGIVAEAINGSGSVIATSVLGLDPAYGNNGVVQISLTGQNVVATNLQTDGKILVLTDTELERFNVDGTPDASFGADGVVTLPIWSLIDGSGTITYMGVATSGTGQIAVAATEPTPGDDPDGGAWAQALAARRSRRGGVPPGVGHGVGPISVSRRS